MLILYVAFAVSLWLNFVVVLVVADDGKANAPPEPRAEPPHLDIRV